MNSRNQVLRVLKQVQLASAQCPCHGSGLKHNHNHAPKDVDYAFELATANIRYGPGVTAEVGMDAANMKSKKTVVFTDSKVVMVYDRLRIYCL
jgi:hydroxyacid-oxoacid transhydrogenase